MSDDLIKRLHDSPEKERVPELYPFGSITDGDWVCGRCGETITGCAICAGEIVSVVRVRGWGK
jgi:hypothetical protein